MGANDARRGREIGGVIDAGRGGDFGDGNRRCIRGEDGVRRADLGQLSEDGCFERQKLGNGFNDKIGSGEVTHLGRRGKAGAGGISIGLRNAAFGHIFRKQLICRYGFSARVILWYRKTVDMLYRQTSGFYQSRLESCRQV